jgi:hypothetical protein
VVDELIPAHSVEDAIHVLTREPGFAQESHLDECTKLIDEVTSGGPVAARDALDGSR